VCCTKFRRQGVGVSVPSESALHYLVVNGQILKKRFLIKKVTVNMTRSFRRSGFVTCSVKQYVMMRLIQCQLTQGMVLLKQNNILASR
jgi:hypothetical protein